MTAPAKKPASRVGGDQLHCYCNRPAHEHPTRACSVFQVRPCVCHHAHSAHLGACTERGCDCRGYREDRTPEFLLRSGIHAGDWQFIAAPQLEYWMRPGHPVKMRVWACGMLDAIGNRRRVATHMNKAGKIVPTTPTDILRRLNALDSIARLDMPAVCNAIVELHEEGAARKHGKWKGQVRLCFYLRPLPLKQAPKDGSVSQILVYSDNNFPASDTKNDHLRDALILRLRGSVVKHVLGALRKELEADGIVVDPDNKERVLEILEPALNVVCEAYNQALIVVKNGGVYKEDSIPSSNEAQPSSSSLRSFSVVEESEHPSASTTTIEPVFDPTAPLNKTLFHQELQKVFVEGDKPAPTKQQSDQAHAKLEADARGFYIDDLRARISGIWHPGALAIDAATYAESWPRRKDKLLAEWKQRQEFAARRAQQHTDLQDEGFKAAERTLADSNASEFEKELAREIVEGGRARVAGG